MPSFFSLRAAGLWSLMAVCGLLVGGGAVAGDNYPGYGAHLDGRAVVRAMESVLVETIAQAERSVVSIARISRDVIPDSRLDGVSPRDPKFLAPNYIPNEFGSGLIVQPAHDPAQRLILTNYHVVKGGRVAGQPTSAAGDRLYVRFADRRGCDATILAADPRSDLAVLRLELDGTTIQPAQLPPITLGEPELPRKGQMVMTLGNPYAMARDGSASAGWGLISNIARRPAPPEPFSRDDDSGRALHHFGTLLQIDSRMNLGTSGGALVNLKGEVIGMTTALAALDGYEKSVGYAVPFDAPTRRIIDDLTHGYEVEYGLLGIGPATVGPAELQQVPLSIPKSGGGETALRKLPSGETQWSAARVGEVARNSPASLGGVQSDDIILRVNDRPVFTDEDLIRDIGRLRPEETVQLLIWRPRTRAALQLPVKLGKWPVRNDEEIIATRTRPGRTWRGITIDYATARLRPLQMLGLERHYPDAVLVTALDAARLEAARNDQQPTLYEGAFISHINGQPVRSPAEFQQVVEGLRKGAVPVQTTDGLRAVIPPDAR